MILWFLLFWIFVSGLFIGSFLNVVIDRVYRGEQFFKGRSYCETCKHALEPQDLVPVFSYLSLKGRCRYCKGKIPVSLPVVELMTGLSLAGLAYYLASLSGPQGVVASPAQLIPLGIFYFLLLMILLLIFFTDLKYYVIPNVYLYLLGGIYLVGGLVYYLSALRIEVLETSAIAYFLVSFYVPLKWHLLSALIMGLFFAILHFGSNKKAMGEGDIYLSAILALFLGPALSIVMWFVSFFTGAVTGVALVLVRRKKLKSKVPFGPFLIIGFVVAFLFGSVLFDLYLRLL